MSPRTLRASIVCTVLAGAIAGVSGPLRAQEVPAPIYRVFLTDGTSVAAYGEWVRVGERVVFTVAVGEEASSAMHLASVPAAHVDWPATERYRDGLRAAQYAASQGDADFAQLTEEVARLLSDAGLAADPARKLALADEARRRLMDWPATHYGHRADEVRQILMLVEEVVSGLRAARGDTSFDLRLVASAAPPPVRLMPAPTLRESISQALRLAELAETPADRQSLLRTVSGVLAGPTPADDAWVDTARKSADRALRQELDTEASYASIRARAMSRASRAAARADVRGVERAIARYRQDDARLGSRRPDTTQGVLAALDAQLDAARRLRLARDQWAAKRDDLLAYRRVGRSLLGDLRGGRHSLDDIKELAGPSLAELDTLERRVRGVQRRLAAVTAPPPDALAVHALTASAAQLSLQAATLRRRAISAGDLAVARDASAAAAGALMLIERARTDLETIARRPELQ